MGNSTYTMIKVGEGTAGGIMKHPVPGAPSSWLAYVLVDDIAAADKKGEIAWREGDERRNGSDGRGSFSIIVDPTGAALGLWKRTKK